MKWSIIKQFSISNRNCFRYKEVVSAYPEKDPSHLSKVLAEMVRKGMLMKLTRDLYHIIPLSENPETFSPDSRLVARYLMKGKEYYIAYCSAMHIHGLQVQPELRTMVVTRRQMQPSVKTIRGTEYHFVYHSYSRFFGYQEMWITKQEQAMVSDLEKTIVDAVSKPHLCKGIIEIGKAIYRSKEKIDLQKLFYYFARNHSHAAKKRYLFLSDLLGMEWSSDHERMLEESGSSISLLDTTGPDQGKQNSRFGLKINIKLNTLIDSCAIAGSRVALA